MSRKKCINIEDNIKSSKFIYTVIVVARTIKLLEFVTPPSIYQQEITTDVSGIPELGNGRIILSAAEVSINVIIDISIFYL